MPRVALNLVLSLAATLTLAPALGAPERTRKAAPHLDDRWVPAGCVACHSGHGQPASPMLPSTQGKTCATCHGSPADRSRAIGDGLLSPEASPPLLDTPSASTFRHPLSEASYSSIDPSVVVCTSCHSPHRESAEPRNDSAPSGRRRLSPKSRNQFEFELCEGCHSAGGDAESGREGIARLLDPSNRSFHPVHEPAPQSSPSVVPELRGAEINCTDCHGSREPEAAAGPHFSSVRYILRQTYTTEDGAEGSQEAYALCDTCHDRKVLMAADGDFPAHRLHVVDLRTSCATCHDPHGSIENRALIRFGERTISTQVQPSPSAGRLEFRSDVPGSGTCWLLCHGSDHGPKSYGPAPPGSGDEPLDRDSKVRQRPRPPGSRSR